MHWPWLGNARAGTFHSVRILRISSTLSSIPIYPYSGIRAAIVKTTIEISDLLLKEAKRVAAREGTTLRTLVEQGLRHELKQRSRSGTFRLRKETFRGTGLQPGAKGLSWDQLRELAYTGRGT